MAPRLNRFFPYTGSKRQMARFYPPPEQNTIVEPFAGSAGYSLEYWSRKVRLFDVDPLVVGLWRWLIRARPEDVLALPILRPGERVSDLGLDEAPATLIRAWGSENASGNLRHDAVAGRHNRPAVVRSHLGPTKAFSANWSAKVRASVARQLEAIRHWTAELADYREIPDVRATWFIDPPYESLDVRYGPKIPIDRAELAAWCRRRQGLAIVCEAEPAAWLPFTPFRGTWEGPGFRGLLRVKGTFRTTELIWVARN